MQLNKFQQSLLISLSFLIVAFGQPYWSAVSSFFASIVGFGLFFRLLCSFENPTQRFWIALAWFTAVQLVQFTWFLSHPYIYIVSVYVLISLFFGIQWGFLGILADPYKIRYLSRIVLIASVWTLFEWSRLFILSGFAFNPLGLSLSANIYALQTASLWGVFGMSFWVLFVNLIGLKAWLAWPQKKAVLLWGFLAILPYVFGYTQLTIHGKNSENVSFNVVLVQPVLPIEENLPFENTSAYIRFVHSEWEKILLLAKEHLGKKIDLIALPEFIVPFATYTPIFRFEETKNTFLKIFGHENLANLPSLHEPLAKEYFTSTGSVWMVSNAYWLQAMSNVFKAPVIAGMMDVVDFFDGHRESYSAAQYVVPTKEKYKDWPPFKRYDKRILVPMGEYIPFSFCRDLAASYGITGSFTPGQTATIFPAAIPFGVSICYEETFGHLMREARLNGAELLVNLTSDIWYPTVAQQHCDHARLRTTENGIPLVRACNTGITTGFDCLGRELATHGETSEDKIWTPGALYIQVPVSSFHTLYSIWGDYFIVLMSLLGIGFSFLYRS